MSALSSLPAPVVSPDALPPPDPSRTSGGDRLSLAETLFAIGVAVGLAVLRWFSVYNHPWNSDEPQHLHVVWAWTAGLLPYRDIFDNHTPLFHLVMAPVLRLLGERADIVEPMRLAMAPLFALCLWLVYRLTRDLYSHRSGILAALLAAACWPFFTRMGEFRTDVLWTTLWLASLAAVLGGRLTPKRSFSAALLLGAAFSVSMKSSLLLLTLAVAGLITWAVRRSLGLRAEPETRPVLCLLAGLGGLIIVPGILLAYFAAHGATEALYRCVIAHNMLPGDHVKSMIGKQLLSRSSLSIIPILGFGALLVPMLRRDPALGSRRLYLLLATGFFYPLLHGLWPVITMQDYLPWFPLLPVTIAPAFWWLGEALASRTAGWVPRWVLPLLLLGLDAGYLVHRQPALHSHPNQRHILALSNALKLADPGDFVLDTKGETIFRQRPGYLVMEGLTMRQLKNGVINDDTVARMIETRTPVARLNGHIPIDVQNFVSANYLHLEHTRVLGKLMPAPKDGEIQFDLAIPERYLLVARKGTVSGTLDGEPIDGARWLSAGPHTLKLDSAPIGLTLIWARAWERGFSPFKVPAKKNSEKPDSISTPIDDDPPSNPAKEKEKDRPGES